MSDEFEVANRTFKDGHDPLWTALDKSDDDASSAGGGSLQFYNSSAVTTENGMLRISTTIGKTTWNRYDHVNKEWRLEQTNFTSGMVQSWEKFCFTGGIVEIDVIFPGEPYIGGLWPAIWMLGNLGRATYEASTNNIWPWSYDTCDRNLQQAQTLSACNRENHFGMNPFQGRGATEIDIAEVMTGYSSKPLVGTNPPVRYPYCDLTLQVWKHDLLQLDFALVYIAAAFLSYHPPGSISLWNIRLLPECQKIGPNRVVFLCASRFFPPMATLRFWRTHGTTDWSYTETHPSTLSFTVRISPKRNQMSR